MAEVYGVKPKRFTKEWWPYFWMYYKAQTIGIAIALLMIVVTVYQCATKEKYDVNVNYLGSAMFDMDMVAGLENALEPFIEDVDGNGKNRVFFQQLNLGGDAEVNYAMQMKHDLELSNETSYLYIYDEEEAKLMLDRENADDLYLEVSEWATQDIPEERLLRSESGKALAVLVDGSEFLAGVGIKTHGMYMAIKKNYSEDEVNKSAQRSAVAMADAILK